jgi:hypothetical protein
MHAQLPVPNRKAVQQTKPQDDGERIRIFPSDDMTAQQWGCMEAGHLNFGRRQVTFQRMEMFERTNRQRNLPVRLCAVV